MVLKPQLVISATVAVHVGKAISQTLGREEPEAEEAGREGGEGEGGDEEGIDSEVGGGLPGSA